MSKSKQVGPVLEDSKFKGIQHVNVDKTVQVIRQQLESNEQVTLVARQSEISRAGMIMKRVEEDCKARIVSMKTENRDEKNEDREFKVLYFKATFTKAI